MPATQVAEWAGHSVEVLLTICATCIEGRDRVWFGRIDDAPGDGREPGVRMRRFMSQDGSGW